MLSRRCQDLLKSAETRQNWPNCRHSPRFLAFVFQIQDEIWAGVEGSWAGGGAGGGLDSGFLTRSALGTKIAVDESGAAVAVAARENWLAVHPLGADGGRPGHVFAGRGAGGGSEWIMVEQLDGAVRDVCFVPGGAKSGWGVGAAEKRDAFLAVCLLKHSDAGLGCVVLVRACWGGGDSASTHVVVTLIPPTGGDVWGDAAFGGAHQRERQWEGQGGCGRFLTGVSGMPGGRGLVILSDEAGARLLDLAPICNSAQAGAVGEVRVQNPCPNVAAAGCYVPQTHA